MSGRRRLRRTPRVGLVLGGGGIAGLAFHAGTLAALHHDGEMVGVLAVGYGGPLIVPQEWVESLLVGVAAHAAIAIENARLHERSRELSAIEERNRLARDLHDSVVQNLFGVVLAADAAATLIERDGAQARDQVERVRALAQDAIAELRALVFQLRPAAIETEGQLRARARGKGDAVKFLRAELARYPAPIALRSRIQKRINLIELEGRKAPAWVAERHAGTAPPTLESLRGRTHEVVSGVCVVAGGREASEVVTTRVTMREFTDAEIDAYIASGDPTCIIDGKPVARDRDVTACGAIIFHSQEPTIDHL